MKRQQQLLTITLLSFTLGCEAGPNALMADAQSNAADAAPAAADALASCPGMDVLVSDFEVLTTSNQIQVSVSLSQDAPCEVSYRLTGEDEWNVREPREDSYDYGAALPHQQTIAELPPGTYQVRARDHVTHCYETETVEVVVEAISCAYSWALPAGVGYPEWNSGHWESLFPLTMRYAFGEVRSALIDGVMAHVHRVVPTSAGQTNGSSKIQAHWDLPPTPRYVLTQRVRLPNDFAAGIEIQSGKLGLGLGGGTTPTGGQPDPRGFSARLTFRGDQSQPDTEAVVSPVIYVYAADQSGIYGDELVLRDSLGSPLILPRGQWVTIVMEVVMNSAGNTADGQLRAWLDGELGLEETNRQWMTDPPQVDSLILATFHGGANSRWAPSHTNEIAFADVCVSE